MASHLNGFVHSLKVAASGSIVKAAQGDAVRQSQFSRQIKELEDFFRVKLIERLDRGMQLTSNGRELARISRFFLLGLSNFQRGCLSEDQTFHIAASTTLLHQFLIPVILEFRSADRFVIEPAANDDEIERRLHDLTLDFAILTRRHLSRPLQLKEVGAFRLSIFIPKKLYATRRSAMRALNSKSLPLALAVRELDATIFSTFSEPRLICDSFLSANIALQTSQWAALLPDFLAPELESARFWQIPVSTGADCCLHLHLAWNPRLLRLNPHVVRTRDHLIKALSAKFRV